MSKRYGLYIVLKGAYTSVSTPGGNVYFNSTGNPGMATGGSGDVLTGILTGLLAQGYTPLEACLLGVYVHGLAGDISLHHQSPESLIASDMIDHLGLAFQQIMDLK
jgi:NAD(P)H-hydrate epimerase